MTTRWRAVASRTVAIGLCSTAIGLQHPVGVTGGGRLHAEARPPAVEGQVPPPGQQKPPPGQQKPPLKPVPVLQIDERLPEAIEERRFSVGFSEPIAIRDLVLLLVADTGLSVVLDPDVQGTFVGDLKNVNLRQALDLALTPLGLQYSIRNNAVRVSRRALETRIFAINCLPTRRSSLRSLTANTGVDAGRQAPPARGRTVADGNRASVIASEESDLFEEIAAGLKTLLSPDGKFNLDRKASLVQVTDYADRLDRVGVYLEAVEARVNRQVHIQARVIEVELSQPFSTGINWSTLLRAGAGVTAAGEPAPAGGGALSLGVSLRDFDAFLRALAAQGRVRVLASPSVVAMNNEPAVMRVGTDEVYFLCLSETEDAAGRVTPATATPQTVTEGVVLSVTPQISGDGMIAMSVAPTVTGRAGQATSRYGDTVPILSVREANTVVRIREGETMIIAGLMQERPFSYEHRVPVLGDIPLLGGLFRHDEQATRRTDLVILLTPTTRAPAPAAADKR